MVMDVLTTRHIMVDMILDVAIRIQSTHGTSYLLVFIIVDTMDQKQFVILEDIMGEDKDAFGKQNTEIHSHRDS